MNGQPPQAPIQKQEGQKQQEDKNLIAILSYLGILFLIPLLAAKESSFAQFHARQGLVLFIAQMATLLIAWIPILGWIAGFVLWIIWFVFAIIGIINVLGGKQKPLPWIGKFAGKIKV